MRTFVLRTTAPEYFDWLVRRASQRDPPPPKYFSFSRTYREPWPYRDGNDIVLAGVEVGDDYPDDYNDCAMAVALLSLSLVGEGLLVEARCLDLGESDSVPYLAALVDDSLQACNGKEIPPTQGDPVTDRASMQLWVEAGHPFLLNTSPEEYHLWLSSGAWAWSVFSDWAVVREDDRIVLQRPNGEDMIRVIEIEVKPSGEQVLAIARWLEPRAIEWRLVMWALILKSIEEFGGRRMLARELEKYERDMPDTGPHIRGTVPQSEVRQAGEESSPEADTPLEPWTKIGQSKKREAVRLLWEGLQDPEIADKLGVASKTVSNWFSELRGVYGPEIVPTRDDLRRGSPG